jgi:hypothetical protein
LPLLAFAPNGEPIDIVNHYVNFGAEYVYHCHILSHEEMDMMHAVSYAFPPVAPSGLAFDVATRNLSWIDNSLSETAFIVEKSTDGVAWTEAGRVDRVVTALNTTGGMETFTDPDWVGGERYRVVALNVVGDTWDYSDPNLNEIAPGTYAFPVANLKATSEELATGIPPAPPAAPSDLSGVAISTTQIDLSWTDNANNEDGFVIESCQGAGCTNFAPAGQVGADVVAFSIQNLAPNTLYRFRINAYNAVGPSGFSNTVDVTTLSAGPAAPTNLTLTQTTLSRIRLNWTDNSINEQGFYIERLNGTWTRIATVGANVTSYVNRNLTPGTYTYRVQAYNASGVSEYSNEATLTMSGPPAAPTGLVVTGVTANTVSLSWTDNSNNETRFRVQRRLVGGTWGNARTVGANVTTYTYTGLTTGRAYQFRVRAENASGNSAWSNVVGATPR